MKLFIYRKSHNILKDQIDCICMVIETKTFSQDHLTIGEAFQNKNPIKNLNIELLILHSEEVRH